MHPRLSQLPEPTPDHTRMLGVLRREHPDRVPLIELAIHPAIIGQLLEESIPASGDEQLDRKLMVEQAVRAQHRLGFDVVKVSAFIPWRVRRQVGHDGSALSMGDDARQWADEHAGPIGTRADLDNYRWPTAAEIDFSPVEAASRALPEGMALLGFCGGVLEFAMDLIGMERFFIESLRAPDLVAAVIERVGEVVYGIFETYCRMERVCALWLGDDLGHKHGTLVSPRFLEERIFPWYARYAELAHRHGRPFLLHTCGNTDAVMPALIERVGIDAKHSFEDGIEPVETFAARWGERVAVLGGVDVHLLSTGDEEAVRRRTREILTSAAPRGGYACGTGNSVTNYIPVGNYLALIETAAEFNAARGTVTSRPAGRPRMF